MISKFKTYLTLFSLVLALSAGGYGFYSKVRADRLQNERDNAVDELTVKTEEVITYQNKLDKTVTKTIEYKKSLDLLKISKDSIEKQLYKTAKASNLKSKQITSLTKIIAHGNNTGKFDSVIVNIDSIFNTGIPIQETITKYYNDGFLDVVCTDTSFSYSVNLELDIIDASQLVERTFFLWKWIGWKKLSGKGLVEVTSNIPNSKMLIRKIKTK